MSPKETTMTSISDETLHLETDVVIIGAGPTGLTAAYQLSKIGKQTVVLEKDKRVGGIARTEIEMHTLLASTEDRVMVRGILVQAGPALLSDHLRSK